MSCYVGALAQDTYTIAGDQVLFGTNWDPADTNNDMTNIPGTNRYYLVKSITPSNAAANTYKFKVVKNHAWENGSWSYNKGEKNKDDNDNTNDANAQVILYGRDPIDLIFTFDSDNTESLDVVARAKIQGSSTSSTYLSTGWNMTQDKMTFDSNDHYFHLTKTYTVSGPTTFSFKAIAQHRNTTYYATDTYNATNGKYKYKYGDAGFQWNGNEGGNDVAVTLPYKGEWEVEYYLDPVMKSAPWVDVRFKSFDFTIGAAGLATFSFPRKVGVPEGLTAYYVTGHNGDELTTATTTVIPATEGTTPQQGTGFILKGTQGTYRFVDSDATASITGNKLYGTGANSYLDASNATYVFGQGDSDLGFFKAGGTTNETKTYAPFKAFLMASDVEGSGARSFLSVDFASATSIAEVGMSQQTANHIYYNLQGQPVEHPTKGLYIVDGRKVVVK